MFIRKQSSFLFCPLRATVLLKYMSIVIAVFSAGALFSQEKDDSAIINEYVKSLGYTSYISFDASNIKQFWIDNSVVSKNGSIVILPKSNHLSEKLKLQLANVVETQDCKVDVLFEEPDTVFSVMNQKSEVLSSSSQEKDFIQYHVASASFHLESLEDFSFSLQFSSKSSDTISIKKIILSFSDNKSSMYLGSPGFNSLLKEFDERGISVEKSEGIPVSDVKYLISKEFNKVFLKIPSDQVSKYSYFYHVFPVNESDLLSDRSEYKFNNYDFNYRKKGLIIPKPFNSTNPYTIIQVELPSFPFSTLRIGQYEPGIRYWIFEINNKDNQ